MHASDQSHEHSETSTSLDVVGREKRHKVRIHAVSFGHQGFHRSQVSNLVQALRNQVPRPKLSTKIGLFCIEW